MSEKLVLMKWVANVKGSDRLKPYFFGDYVEEKDATIWTSQIQLAMTFEREADVWKFRRVYLNDRKDVDVMEYECA